MNAVRIVSCVLTTVPMLFPGIVSLASINAIVLICVCLAPLFTPPAGPDAEASAENGPYRCSLEVLVKNVPRGFKSRERDPFFRSAPAPAPPCSVPPLFAACSCIYEHFQCFAGEYRRNQAKESDCPKHGAIISDFAGLSHLVFPRITLTFHESSTVSG